MGNGLVSRQLQPAGQKPRRMNCLLLHAQILTRLLISSRKSRRGPIYIFNFPGISPVLPASFCNALPVPRFEIYRLVHTYHCVRRIVMPARSTFFHFATKAAMLFGALFVVSVLLAAIPGHRVPATQSAPNNIA